MIPESRKNYYLQRFFSLVESAENNNFADSVILSYKLALELISELIELEEQYFPTNFSRIVFIANKFNFSSHLTLALNRLRYINSRNYNSPVITDAKNSIFSISTIKLLFETVFRISFIGVKKYQFAFSTKKFKHVANSYLQGYFTVVKCHEPIPELMKIELRNEDSEEITFHLSNQFHYLYEIISEGNEIFAEGLKKLQTNKYKDTYDTLIVVEPNFKFDVTDLTHAYSNNDILPILFFINLFKQTNTSINLLIGNITNSFFDSLLYDYEQGFSELYENALKSNAIQLFAISIKEPDFIKKNLKYESTKQYHNLRKILPKVKKGIYSVEPAFSSVKYGIQGRLDLLIENQESHEKDIIELKSGGVPSLNFGYFDEKNKIITGVWRNNLSQITSYNMLLQDAYGIRNGESMMLYSKATDHAIRNVPNITASKRNNLYVRNLIFSIISKIAKNDFSDLENLRVSELDNVPKYLLKDIERIVELLANKNSLIRKYVLNSIALLFRELLTINLKEESKHIRANPEEEVSTDILNLRLNREKSDFNNLKLVFNRDLINEQATKFRQGDLVILIPEEEIQLYQKRVIKCSLRELGNTELVVSLRNKLINKEVFKYDNWRITVDQNDSLIKRQFPFIIDFLDSDISKQKLILGLSKPSFEESKGIISQPYLSPKQNQILQEAFFAKDYFLLQGPPGTGKTSYFLRALVETYYNKTDKTILLSAYTNRAIDEICNALERISPEFPYIRISSRDSSTGKNSFANLLDELGIRDTFKLLKSIRVVVATTSSLISNKEIFDIKKFDLMIVDEASQILQTQLIGLVNQVEKFVLIGDEKQLPAILRQEQKFTFLDDKDLIENKLNNLSISLFELLIHANKANKFNAIGELRWQGRMHKALQDFPSKSYYGGTLETIRVEQNLVSDIYPANSTSELERILNKHRLVFIDVEPEDNSKINGNEIKIVVAIIKKIIKLNGKIDKELIGIISPFRVQCSEIIKSLSDEVVDLITVDTVERYQGSERNTIILSFAVNKDYQLDLIQSEYEFDGLKVDRKLNVALTRAKEQLILIGNSKILGKRAIYKNLIDYIKEKGYFLSDLKKYF